MHDLLGHTEPDRKTTKTMRILIIEDDKESLEALEASFMNEGFAVDSARDGEQGLDLALSTHYDLMIIDYMLPKKNGDIICREIRNIGISTPIIILSVRSQPEDKVGLLNEGADDYVTKPYSFDELLARVRALMRRSEDLKNAMLTLGDLCIDTHKHVVKMCGRKVNLTRKEFMLLEYLARNKGQTVSKAKIMEYVWDSSFNPFSNTIESHILSLRKKIEQKGKPKMIHTVPCVGYKLCIEDHL